MSSQRWSWARNLAVLGGFEMVFAGVAAVGIFLTASALGVLNGAVALGAVAVVLLVLGALLLRSSSQGGGMLDRRKTEQRKRLYRVQYRGRHANH